MSSSIQRELISLLSYLAEDATNYLTRHPQAKQARDRHRAALAAAYEATLDQTVARIQTSLSKLTDLRYVSIPPSPNILTIIYPQQSFSSLSISLLTYSLLKTPTNPPHHIRSALLTRHLRHLRHAMDRRDATVAQISRRLAEHQKRVLTLAARLDALYKDRADAAATMKEEVASLENAAVGGGEGGRM
jgi:hypothetical protein